MNTPDSLLTHCFDPTPVSSKDPRDELRREYLVQMLRSSGGQASQTPVGLGANLLAEALLSQKLRQATPSTPAAPTAPAQVPR
jgi:hypothetical protein